MKEGFIGYRTLKTGIGAVIAMIIAQKLGLKYFMSAGVITILSLQSTKRQSFKIAFQRIIACLLALSIAAGLFSIFGHGIILFGVFLILFIPLSVKFKVSEGIVVNSVLVTHLLTEKNISQSIIFNEIMLITLGAGVALLLNLHIPSIEGKIKKDQQFIEENMKKILINMSNALKELSVDIDDKQVFLNLEKRLNLGLNRAYINLNNYFFTDESYYVRYMEMRMHQFECIKRMKEHFQKFFMTYEQTTIISKFTQKVAESLHEENTADDLLNDVKILKEDFKKMSLPSTREEFENRAMLFQFLNDMEEFLIIKNNFKRLKNCYKEGHLI